MQHHYGVEIWTAAQLALPANSYPMQLPARARVTAPDSATAQAKGEKIAAAKYGEGCTVTVSQHHRYECCKTRSGLPIDAWLSGSGLDGVIAYGKMGGPGGYLVAVRKADGIHEVDNLAARLAAQAAHEAKPPADCPNCYGQREWSGKPGIAACHFCGQEGVA